MADQPIDDTAGANPVSPTGGKKTDETLKETLEKQLQSESQTLGLTDDELKRVSGGTGSGSPSKAFVTR